MTQSTTSARVNKNTCEASGCFAEATTDIEVKVGHQHTILLNLCENCVAKFQDN
jgi:hypothetical protein